MTTHENQRVLHGSRLDPTMNKTTATAQSLEPKHTIHGTWLIQHGFRKVGIFVRLETIDLRTNKSSGDISGVDRWLRNILTDHQLSKERLYVASRQGNGKSPVVAHLICVTK